MRSLRQVIREGLQKWNVDQFAEMDWTDIERAVTAVVHALNDAGYRVTTAGGETVETGKADKNAE